MSEKGIHNSPATEFKKGMIPWNKGKVLSPEHVEKTAMKNRGRPSWNKGIPMNKWMPEESNEVRKAKISQNNARYWDGRERQEIFRQNPTFMENTRRNLERLRQDPEVERKRLKASRAASQTAEHRAKQARITALTWKDREVRENRIRGLLKALNKRPTKVEARLIDIIQKYNLPYQYTGDGSVIIAGINPDFANCNGAKKVIEIFGIVFHDPDRAFFQVPLVQQEPYRKAIYASLGFDCLILWDEELKKLSDKEIAQKIKIFTRIRQKPSAQLKLRRIE